MIKEKEQQYAKVNRDKVERVICQCLIEAGLLNPEEVPRYTSTLERLDNETLVSKLCDSVNMHKRNYYFF